MCSSINCGLPDSCKTGQSIPNPAKGAEARRGLLDEVHSYRPTYSFMLVDKETNEIVMEAPGKDVAYLKKHFKPMFCRIDYTTRGKEATPALRKDEFILDEYKSARNLVHTPVYHEGKYPGKSKYPAQSGQSDTDLSSELD